MKRRLVLCVAIVAGFGVLSGCGGGGGGGGSSHTRTTKFTVENSEQAIGLMGETMVACQPAEQVKAPAKSTAQTLSLARALPRQLFGFDHLYSGHTGESTGSSTGYGDCIANSFGSIGADWEHDNGSTTFSMSFTNFCRKDPDTGNETIFNGTSQLKQNGKSGAYGPTYNGFDFKTTGSGVRAKTYDVGGGRIGPMVGGPVGTLVKDVNIVISNYSVDFGRPGIDSPYMPTLADPDSDSVSSVVVTDMETGDKVKIEDVRITTYDTSLTTSSLDVTSAWVSGTNIGSFSVTTPTPIIVDSNGLIQSGTIEALGAKGTKVTVEADGEGNYTATVFDGTDETPLTTYLDCQWMRHWPEDFLGINEPDPNE